MANEEVFNRAHLTYLELINIHIKEYLGMSPSTWLLEMKNESIIDKTR